MYQVLARKWRPKNFHELVGQTHVTQALTYALDHDRLHHAYLFTGTRGVGKTTIARIFAKSLNCLTNGVSSNPCGQCAHCHEIDQGKFPDLIEVDAASRTGVDDTRDLLDNVPYAPAKGRYKVYLIDEVHMFSKSSFNALLKTLEEPPAHVKFILATTDPQKLPATVLSRCLQFHLKNMNERQIVAHLQTVLESEDVEYEQEALRLIAQAANGSMRDGLSLLDQAIAFGQGVVRVAEVANLLGAIPTTQLHTLLKALVIGDGKQLRQCLHEMDEFAPDYGDILARLLEQFQLITIAQLNAEQTLGEVDEFIHGLADALPVELLQLWYQIATDTWRNMPYQPDARLALEMGLLRMIALQPVMPNADLSKFNPLPKAKQPILAEDAPSIEDLAQRLSDEEEKQALAETNVENDKDEKKNSALNSINSIEQASAGKTDDERVPFSSTMDSSQVKMDELLSVQTSNGHFTVQSSIVDGDLSAVPPWQESEHDDGDNRHLIHDHQPNNRRDNEHGKDQFANHMNSAPNSEAEEEGITRTTVEASKQTTEHVSQQITGQSRTNANGAPWSDPALNDSPAHPVDNQENGVDDASRQEARSSQYEAAPSSNQAALAAVRTQQSPSEPPEHAKEVEAALNACVGRAERWQALIKTLDFPNEALMLADFSLPIAWQPPTLTLACEQDNDAWVTEGRCQAMAQTLSHHLQADCQLVVEKIAEVTTPHTLKMAREEARMAKAKQDFLHHPQVKQAIELLKATVDMDSITILDESKESL